ncbi:TRAP transporter large permease [Evansella tamaricis]|uniref:TRAP transporter large permease n=1 Tax=Evansella tamaricis TaxID=2069301 RepID=A0ABS6JFW2_9BACI|nr:TRAP transporter large permease [Evansella tamaricis]MBU9712559.1 TRAP transporter large permease [Evansella tamaricis]
MSLTILFLLFFILILILMRIPIAISLAIATSLFLFHDNFHMSMVPVRIFSSLTSFPLMAIPGFILAGVVMARGGLSKHLIMALRAWVGHFPGGLAVVTILACMIFSAISGSSPATAAAVGAIMIPAMVAEGYDKKYTMGLIAAAGTLGILLPPSIPLIVYGITVEESIGKLFMAGVIPGTILGFTLIVSAMFYAKKRGYGISGKTSLKDRFHVSIKAIWALFLPVLILGSIYSGAVTPTESSVVAVAYAIVVSVIFYRDLKWQDIRPIMEETISLTSMIFLIIGSAKLFGLYLTLGQIPQQIGAWIGESELNKWLFIIIVNLLFFVLGTFLESISIILITLPVIFPMLAHFGIDPIHFAIIMIVNMELAMITPPVGLNLFVVSGIAKDRVESVIRGVIPFFIIFIFVLVLIILFPHLSLWLPGKM